MRHFHFVETLLRAEIFVANRIFDAGIFYGTRFHRMIGSRCRLRYCLALANFGGYAWVFHRRREKYAL